MELTFAAFLQAHKDEEKEIFCMTIINYRVRLIFTGKTVGKITHNFLRIMFCLVALLAV